MSETTLKDAPADAAGPRLCRLCRAPIPARPGGRRGGRRRVYCNHRHRNMYWAGVASARLRASRPPKPPSLTARILAVLGESALPVPTPDLVALAATGLSHARARVWAALRLLLLHGLVSKVAGTRARERFGRQHFGPVACWSLPQPEQGGA